MTKRILLIDNYDSFTYNLYHYAMEVGAQVEVVRNDDLTADEALEKGADGIMLSPGPCDPDKAGICLDVVQLADAHEVPLLGICLGHEAIAQHFGGRIVRAPTPMHGKTSEMHHDGTGIFDGLANPFEATRYHSLIADASSLPECLRVTAKTQDGIVMGLSHVSKPIHGVQFHPESIATKHGHDLLKNFVNMLG